MICIVVQFSNGDRLVSDASDEVTRGQLEEGLAELLVDWSKFSNFSVVRDGHPVFVNPSQVSAVWIEEV